LRSTIRLAALAAPLVLAACAGKAPELDCPTVAALQPANHVVRTKGSAQDLASRVIDARITGIGGKCKRHGPDQVQVAFRVGFAATRGPAATGDRQTLQYFVALVQGERVVDKRIYPVTFDFANAAGQAVETTKPIRIDLPNAPVTAKQEVLVGFEMSPEELRRALGGG
jgi:hypothetical protein